MLSFNTMPKPKVVLNKSLRAGSGKWIKYFCFRTESEKRVKQKYVVWLQYHRRRRKKKKKIALARCNERVRVTVMRPLLPFRFDGKHLEIMNKIIFFLDSSSAGKTSYTSVNHVTIGTLCVRCVVNV